MYHLREACGGSSNSTKGIHQGVTIILNLISSQQEQSSLAVITYVQGHLLLFPGRISQQFPFCHPQDKQPITSYFYQVLPVYLISGDVRRNLSSYCLNHTQGKIQRLKHSDESQQYFLTWYCCRHPVGSQQQYFLINIVTVRVVLIQRSGGAREQNKTQIK